MAWTTRLKVRFGEIDCAGIAYYPNLYHYCHVAFEDFFEQRIGVPYPSVLENDHIGFPTVRVESYFRRPIKYGDELELSVAVTRVGDSSATFEFRGSRIGDRALCFASAHIVVCVDMDTFAPVRIPDRFRERFLEAGAAEGGEPDAS